MPTREEKEELCGFGDCRPSFLQKFASKKPYMIIYGCIGIVQSMMGTYLGSMISTIERRFGIKSKESAYLLSGNEIFQILFLFMMPFIIKVKRRPLWMALSLFCTGIGCILMGVPYLISEEDYLEDINQKTVPAKPQEISNFAKEEAVGIGMCGSANHPSSLEKLCERGIDWVGLGLIFSGIFLTGVGNCFYYTFGLTYLDDNTSNERAPIWLALVFVFKLVGPTLGFLLAGACLKTYDIPSITPDFDEKDPRWIGAWWLGPPIIGLLIILFALPLMLFPERLPKSNTDAAMEKQKTNDTTAATSQEGFKAAMMRLLKNKLFMYNWVSNFFYVFAFKGFGTFMQKYMEYQFRITASKSANFGGFSIFTSAIGLLSSGFVLSKCRLSARLITGWNVVIFGFILGWLLLFGNIGCPTTDMFGEKTTNGINITVSCNSHCGCPVARPEPICSKDGVTNFYSPCAAGCTGPTKTRFDFVKKKNLTIYTGCGCANVAWEKNWETQPWEFIGEPSDKKWDVEEYISRDEAVKGYCEVDCGIAWTIFIVCGVLTAVLVSTGRVGNLLVAFRYVY